MGVGTRLAAEKLISVASNTLSFFLSPLVALMMTRSPTSGTLAPFELLSSLYRVFLLTCTSTVPPLGVLTSTCVALMAVTVPSTCWSVPSGVWANDLGVFAQDPQVWLSFGRVHDFSSVVPFAPESSYAHTQETDLMPLGAMVDGDGEGFVDSDGDFFILPPE